MVFLASRSLWLIFETLKSRWFHSEILKPLRKRKKKSQWHNNIEAGWLKAHIHEPDKAHNVQAANEMCSTGNPPSPQRNTAFTTLK